MRYLYGWINIRTPYAGTESKRCVRVIEKQKDEIERVWEVSKIFERNSKLYSIWVSLNEFERIGWIWKGWLNLKVLDKRVWVDEEFERFMAVFQTYADEFERE